ncbi:hypothetical protein ETAA8_13730 [Anatilimnocola aggregata]|uniref:Uncharacterized protein n=1 Tax=Anatilimnocola aggregata TaxID=2528021 RepID=A0A517Y7W3_9BACT|nr:hypothetical protein [Anatilimnocola aggregata]QDU26295.1 hypothetical protein ETAA8_13730 [Anatilimnocola aggregata]
MPIRFACQHCDQKLSVGSQKAGTKANCPRCKEAVRVPGVAARQERVTAQSMLVMAGKPEPLDEPIAPPLVGGQNEPSESPLETSELVFDTGPSTSYEEKAGHESQVAERTDYNLVSFPRYVLYAQAGLVAGVAIVCFTLGALMGSAFFRGQPDVPIVAKPCTISGFVEVTQGVVKKGDEGAVVVVLPFDVQKLDERSPVEGLRPKDAPPDETHRGLSILRTIGGAYAKADRTGKYEVRVPRQGKYFVLVISRAKAGKAGEVDSLDLRKIARFFENATELIGGQKYQFSEERLLADRKFDVSFE